MRFLYWLITLPLLIAAIFFAMANRAEVVLSLWPLDTEISTPLYLITLGTLFLGILFGAAMTGVTMLRYRWQMRGLRKQVAKLEVELSTRPPAPSASVSERRKLWGPRA